MAISKFELFNSLQYAENDFVEKKILFNVTASKKYVNNKQTDEIECYKYSIFVKGKVTDIVTVKIPSLLVNPDELKEKGMMLVKTKGIKIKPYESKTGEIKWTGTAENLEVFKGQEAKIFDDLFKVE
jgi:DNA-directed RNA polymerase subunit RPC12/RpoP